jgi:hypothetical protein
MQESSMLVLVRCSSTERLRCYLCILLVSSVSQMSALSQEAYVQQELERLTQKIDAEEKKPKGDRDGELLEQWRQEKKEMLNKLPSSTMITGWSTSVSIHVWDD